MRAFFAPLLYLFVRFRFPYALPEEVTSALGLSHPSTCSFDAFFRCLTSPKCCATKLRRFMPRTQAEKVFESATCKERFKQNSLYSFYFAEGWVEFMLIFDEDSRLRRLYLQHQWLGEACEIKLFSEESSR